MTTRNQSHGGREAGLAWYLVPTLCAAAVAGFLLLSYGPALLADPAQGERGAAASPVVLETGSEFNVPAATTVFKDRHWEVSELVEQF
jgi:hypothetical protein